MKIYFHGTTSKKKAVSILKTGFRKGTWFANHLEDALHLGGRHIFLVAIEWQGKRAYDWQICSANRISAKRIVEYVIYDSNVIKKNEKLREEVFESNN